MAPLVLEAARSGDAIAETIVQRAADELALSVLTVAAKLVLPQALPLALAGSLLTREAAYRTLVLDAIRRHHELGQVAVVDCPAEAAAQAARW
jgi:N-acetylglucosamine kinase-like BadF-type ATPase